MQAAEETARAARYRDLFGSTHTHEPACSYCPFCAAVGALGETKPEVVEHLAAAAREFLAAVGLVIDEAQERLRRVDGTAAPHETPFLRPVDGG